MAEGDLLRFRVEAYTPDTMPMARLANYLAELAALLGETGSVHFVKLEPGSTAVVHKVDAAAAPRVRARVADVRDGRGPGEARRAYDKINSMLRDDKGSAKLAQSDTGAVIIEFPGTKATEGGYTGVAERGSIDGKLIRVGGKTDEVPVLLQRGRIDYANIYTNRATASALGKVLFEPVRLFGLGRWSRTTKGDWLLDRFKVETFDVLEKDRLSTVVANLRDAMGAEPVGLPSLAELRSGEAA